MADEIAAAAAVVEAKVEAEGAKQEAQAATVAAVTAEAAAGAAVAEAHAAHELAERAEAKATIDAEERIAAFKGELEKCLSNLESLSSMVRVMQEHHQSISQELTQLAWLKDLPAGTELMVKRPKEASGTSSEAAGSTLAGGAGETSNPGKSSGEPVKEKVNPGEGQGGPAKPNSPEKKEEKDRERRKHTWL